MRGASPRLLQFGGKRRSVREAEVLQLPASGDEVVFVNVIRFGVVRQHDYGPGFLVLVEAPGRVVIRRMTREAQRAQDLVELAVSHVGAFHGSTLQSLPLISIRGDATALTGCLADPENRLR